MVREKVPEPLRENVPEPLRVMDPEPARVWPRRGFGDGWICAGSYAGRSTTMEPVPWWRRHLSAGRSRDGGGGCCAHGTEREASCWGEVRRRSESS